MPFTHEKKIKSLGDVKDSVLLYPLHYPHKILGSTSKFWLVSSPAHIESTSRLAKLEWTSYEKGKKTLPRVEFDDFYG